MGLGLEARPFVIVPLHRWTRITEKGFRLAMKLSDLVQAVHVDAEKCDEVKEMWQRNVDGPSLNQAESHLSLCYVRRRFTMVLDRLVEYISKVERDHPERQKSCFRSRASRQLLVARSVGQSARLIAQTHPHGSRKSAHHRH
jgi:E3 ubiquitin-protein ligase DOA10